MVVPELKLSQVAVQVLLADGMIDAVAPAFHDREEAFDRVAVIVAPDVFTGTVGCRFMAAFELFANRRYRRSSHP